ncbi:hypothetical protein NDU88_001117 [Pleurodeles waltl]|uniref:Uncharacterized protein n=1 Tax=Pleurodeles waltl TaxID=8319 RepID=A0AAV7Q4U8_PLEWA|nr:hypothetical protein NDU88_001117 [Pleurodeles waltl]
MFTWGARQPVVNMGKFVETLTYNDMSVQEEMNVVQADVLVPCLLSNVTVQVMGLLAMTYGTADRQNILKEYLALLKGLGKLKDAQVTLRINKAVQLVPQTHSRVPIHLQLQVEELKRLLAQDIIMLAEGPAPWLSTGRSPSELVVGRTSSTRLSQLDAKAPTDHDNIAARDRETKEKMKRYADARRHATGSGLQLGDWVLVHQRQAWKLDSPFWSQLLRKTKIKGSMITAEAGPYFIQQKDFRMSDDEEGELWPSAGRETTSADPGGSEETVSTTGDSHPWDEDTTEDIDQETGTSRPMRTTRNPKRLIEEL